MMRLSVSAAFTPPRSWAGMAVLLNIWLAVASHAGADSGESVGRWTTHAPRDELRPEFGHRVHGGRDGTSDALVIRADQPGRHGWFAKSFPVKGGDYYEFRAARMANGLIVPRRAVVARIVWHDDQGQQVLADPPPGDNRLNREGYPPLAYAEHPRDVATGTDGWVELHGTYRAPSRATQAIVELHLIADAASEVAWSHVDWQPISPPPPRKVRLAAIHYRPSGGKTRLDNARQYVPLLAEAARRQADLVVLGETLTYVGLDKRPHEVAEPIPGPTTDFFAKLAREHGFYIVVGLYERDAPRVYNVAVLLAPDGTLVGKYRKVCLPRDEIIAGVTPGDDYPVFETSFGRVGLMVCYDGFFPEVARELANRGAEVIAWPVWGCNPLLAAARACENHVYLVSSTYTDAQADWTKTAVYGHDGQVLVEASETGSVVVAEVDLNARHFWRNNLGDFKAENFRHRPATHAEVPPLDQDAQRPARIQKDKPGSSQ